MGNKLNRDSNMELLRIVSMLFVLVIHANGFAAPFPEGETILASPGNAFIRYFIEALTAVCVNSFILLSGWFGIKFSIKRLLCFCFQVYFFSILMMLVFDPDISKKDWFIIITLDHFWFVKAYIILFILSPALNYFAEKADRRLYLTVLIIYYLYQTIISYINNSPWYDDGYSPLPFIGLYLLAQYVHKYSGNWDKKIDILAYLSLSLIITLVSLILLSLYGTGGRMFNYTNPLLVASSVFFVLFFSKLKLQSKWINWIAISSVAAYLIHLSPDFAPIYSSTLQNWYKTLPVFDFILYSFGFILLIFFTGVLIDKIRILLWDRVAQIIPDKKE